MFFLREFLLCDDASYCWHSRDFLATFCLKRPLNSIRHSLLAASRRREKLLANFESVCVPYNPKTRFLEGRGRDLNQFGNIRVSDVRGSHSFFGTVAMFVKDLAASTTF